MLIEITKRDSNNYPYHETIIVNTDNIIRIEDIGGNDTSGGYDGEFMRARICFTDGSATDVCTGYRFLCESLNVTALDWRNGQ